MESSNGITDVGYSIGSDNGLQLQRDQSINIWTGSSGILSGNTFVINEDNNQSNTNMKKKCVKRRRGIKVVDKKTTAKVKIRTNTHAFLCVNNGEIAARKDEIADEFELHKCIAYYKPKPEICCMIKWNDYLLQAVDVSNSIELQLTKISVDDAMRTEEEISSSFIFKRKTVKGSVHPCQSFESLLFKNFFMICTSGNKVVLSNCNPKDCCKRNQNLCKSIGNVPIKPGYFGIAYVKEIDYDSHNTHFQDGCGDTDRSDTSDHESHRYRPVFRYLNIFRKCTCFQAKNVET